ncbi:NINE protein [Fulvivirgaceae bacterium BMA10]|uniref:NINE protein n=1 Tax=Splendidivirga corallicola TaxID=3051826 RepID=A0ABT8KNM3_9BACT|nr:NINE protein [Fulvivirgaceae bacterium BMA10]
MAKIIDILPELQGQEMAYVQEIIKDMEDEKARSFATIYRARRKDPTLILVTTILGFVVVAGVQRFILGQIGMGLLYLLTGGLCLIGTIVDLINYQSMTFEFNQKQAYEVAIMMKDKSDS